MDARLDTTDAFGLLAFYGAEPAGATPSTPKLKPDHPDVDYCHSVLNDWFVMRLVKCLGLDVSDVHYRYIPSPIFLIA